MSRKLRRRKKQSMFIITGLTIAVCFLLGLGAVDLKSKQEVLMNEQSTLDTEIQEEEDRKKKLEDQKNYMETDEYIEERARNDLGYTYEDELILKPEKK